MARKRLSLPGMAPEADGLAAAEALGPAARAAAAPRPEMAVSAAAMPRPAVIAPIAQVAGDASARAALEELAGEMERARASGRMVEAVPLDRIDADWLHRDRIAPDPEEMQDLLASLRDRGQQAPVEAVRLEEGRYGLISGWRRLMALRQLHAETRESRFATILVLQRRPESSGQAYRAMVEENEIRAGLSYYERARIAALAAEAGAFRDPRAAVNELFAAASKAKRSKIASFLTLHKALGAQLSHGRAIPERLGLKLAQAIEAEPKFGARLADRLRKARPLDPGAEIALLTRALNGEAEPRPARPAPEREEIAPGLWLARSAARPGEVTLGGDALDETLLEELRLWLRRRG